MSVINMFRKEALRHQYKSQEFGQSVIKQPSIISNAIISLCVIMLIGVIAVQFVTLTTNHAYSIKISAENYQPLVMSKAVVIDKQQVNEGQKVNKNQTLANLSIITDVDQSKQTHYLKAPSLGYYFKSTTDSTIIPAFEPIGYLLKNSPSNDFSFWLQENPKSPVKAGELVTLMLNEKTITARIATIVGVFVEGRGQKISLRLDNNSFLSLLSPNAKLKILLTQQPKTLTQLLR